ncbi:peptidase U32 [Desulfonema ishimotonii]|uniref:Peptidase U32 n=1 Tax=Desulfonema ishimotonii TaxID=45657 RepID=A0A401FQD5_9BACT|nr:peptidase U32 family protein [Desulfonema ishimotonii]GBC59132.1 peptidase U32 [Desulfonema ishimotonii]
MNMKSEGVSRPDILAPAGNKAAFLAALAAGADAVYCGLKSFSARMEAKNFSMEELAGLTRLAHERGTKVYITFNTLLRPEEMTAAGQIIEDLSGQVSPDALIIQDPGLIPIVRQAGFAGELHLSTLSNVSFPAALDLIRTGFKDGIRRVVLPRELNIDEIKTFAEACPRGLDLEVFIHGALCYGVSGRCYWSSYFGGKSGLRGRCVQPCRRLYAQGKQPPKRLFSCQDLSLDVLVKVLMSVPEVRVWKIEGRKKGPHYVYYTVLAYKMLRDHGHEPGMKKTALGLLAQALGRTGTHYNFLPQRPQNPVNTGGQTASGLLMGTVKGGKDPYMIPREMLLPGDVLRIGYEDDAWHAIYRVTRSVPKKGRLHLRLNTRRRPSKNAPVFLTDRREKALDDMIRELDQALADIPIPRQLSSGFRLRLPKRFSKKTPVSDLHIGRTGGKRRKAGQAGAWLSPHALDNTPGTLLSKVWWWLPPVIWPDEEDSWRELVARLLKKGGRNVVLNTPWQMAFFSPSEKMNIWAGPFCNIANPLAVDVLAGLGFAGVIVSPELAHGDFLRLPEHSPLPLGVVIGGNWPLCISRVLPEPFDLGQPFTSPKGEASWARQYGQNIWIYPNWKMDLEAHKEDLRKAGYSLFVYLNEPVPPEVRMKQRPGLWNWQLTL